MKRGDNPRKIVIKFIPHKNHRYPTVGDYWIDKHGNWQIRVSQMSDVDSQVGVAIHELFEMGSVISKAVHTKKSPIAEIKKIDAFDIMYEKEREAGKHSPDSEPGHDRRSPYLSHHRHAEVVEKEYIRHVGLTWNEHGDNCQGS